MTKEATKTKTIARLIKGGNTKKSVNEMISKDFECGYICYQTPKYIAEFLLAVR